ncbi:MAG: hypothetical protein H6683_10945 [Deltaproteobacteria bacterium]|nr:hypothetical protein [Deltaproteobacteria bacterium]
MKLTPALILFALIAIATIGALPPDCRGTVVFEDDFESYEIGDEPAPPWEQYHYGEATTTVVDFPDEGGANQALELSSPTNHDEVYLGATIETIATSAKITFDIHRWQSVENLFFLAFWEPSDGTPRENIIFEIFADQLRISDLSTTTPGDVFCDIVPYNSRHQIQVELQFGEASTASILVDGEGKPACTGIEIPSMSDLGFISFIAVGTDAGGYVDNVRIVKFDE